MGRHRRPWASATRENTVNSILEELHVIAKETLQEKAHFTSLSVRSSVRDNR